MDLAIKASKHNSDFLEFAKKFWREAKSIDEFNTLRKMGKKGENLYRLFQQRLPS